MFFRTVVRNEKNKLRLQCGSARGWTRSGWRPIQRMVIHLTSWLALVVFDRTSRSTSESKHHPTHEVR